VTRFAWLAAVLALATPAAAATLTPTEYARTVSEVVTRLEQAAKSGKATQAAEQALRELPIRAEVPTGPGSARLSVDNRALLVDLRRQIKVGPRGIRTAAGILRSLAQAVSATPPRPPAKARATLTRVLARREFRTSALDTWREKVYRWEAQAVLWVLDHLPDTNIPRDAWVVIGYVALFLTGAAIVYLIVLLLVGMGARARPVPDAPGARPVVILPYSAWLAEAEQRLQAGDYRAAVRALHMAALMKLDDAGQVRYDSSYTDGRFVRALQSKGQPDLAGVLGRLNHLFAIVWYGRRAAGQAEYAAARALWTELEAAATP